MIKEFLTIKEASELTGKSINTIKRFIENYSNKSPESFQEYQTKNKSISYKIKRQFLSVHYTVNSDSTDSINDTITDSTKKKNRQEYNTVNSDTTDSKTDTINDSIKEKKEAMQIAYNSELFKQKNETINKLIEGQKRPFIRLPVFWVTIGFIIIIIALLSAGYYYREEILSIYNGKINDLKQNHSKQIESREKELSNQQERYKELKDQYSIMITEIKSSHQKLTSSQEKQITELSNKLKELNKGLKEAETSHTMALKNTDVLHVKYNDKIEKLEEKIKELEQGIKVNTNN